MKAARNTRETTTNRNPSAEVMRSLAWKSALLGASVGAVLLGWGLLARSEGENGATVGPDNRPRVVVIQVPVQVDPAAAQAATATVQAQPSAARSGSNEALQVPALPQKPLFQRPITRTRRS